MITTIHGFCKRIITDHFEKVALDLGVPLLGKLPIRPSAAGMIDHGDVESVQMPEIAQAVDFLTKE